MNAKKVKAIRRAMRKEIANGSDYQKVFHSSKFINTFNEACVRYKVQYLLTGGKQMVKLGKKVYALSGVLPRRDYA